MSQNISSTRRSPKRISSPAIKTSSTRRSPTRRSKSSNRRRKNSKKKSSPVKRRSSRNIKNSKKKSTKRRSKGFSYKKKFNESNSPQSLLDIKTLLNLSGDKKRKLSESLVFFSGIESNFFNSIVNNLQKSETFGDFIQKCENIQMSDLTKLNLVLYMYQITLLLKKSKNSSTFGMFKVNEENGMLLTQETINNSFECPICYKNFMSTEIDGSLTLTDNLQISSICTKGHMYHTKCIKKYIEQQHIMNYEEVCPTCRGPIELKILYLFEKDSTRLLQYEFRDMTDNTSRYLNLAESVKKSFLTLETTLRLDQLTYIEQSREAILTVLINFTNLIQARIRRIQDRISRIGEIGKRAVYIMIDVVKYTCLLFVGIFICIIIDYYIPGVLESVFSFKIRKTYSNKVLPKAFQLYRH